MKHRTLLAAAILTNSSVFAANRDGDGATLRLWDQPGEALKPTDGKLTLLPKAYAPASFVIK